MNHELERMFKEVAMAYFKVLSKHSPRSTGENHEIPQLGSWAPIKHEGHPESKHRLHIALAQVNELHHFRVNGYQ
jgi:hypothetical protein